MLQLLAVTQPFIDIPKPIEDEPLPVDDVAVEKSPHGLLSEFIEKPFIRKLIHSVRWFVVEKTPQAKRARWTVKVLILVGLFVGLFWIVPFPKVIQALLSAETNFVILGLLFSVPSTILTAMQLWPLTRKQGIDYDIWHIIEINLAVKFYNLFVPGTIVGSSVRWYRLAQPGGKAAEALASLAFYRLMEDFITVVFGLAFWGLSGQASAQTVWVAFLALFIVAASFWLLLARASPFLVARFQAWARRTFKHPYLHSMLRVLEKILTAVVAFADLSIWKLWLSFLAGLVAQLMAIASALCLARAVGIELSYVQMGWITSLILLVTQLPFSVAGGVGIRDVGLVALISKLGFAPELALALSFLLFVRGVLLSLVGGLLEGIRTLRNGRVV